jgi:hypothetical protein
MEAEGMVIVMYDLVDDGYEFVTCRLLLTVVYRWMKVF